MKHLICLLAALVLVLACGSDVTGPGEGTPPDTTFYEVIYRVETLDGLPHEMHIAAHINNAEEWVSFDTTVATWEYGFQAMAGDSLNIHFSSRDNYEYIWATIFIDGDWVTGSGNPFMWGSASYRIPE